jgi:Fe-S oxidoreductase
VIYDCTDCDNCDDAMESLVPTLSLTTTQKFELERMSRTIDATNDPVALRELAKQLLQAWQSQKAATRWVMDTTIPMPLAPWDDPLA